MCDNIKHIERGAVCILRLHDPVQRSSTQPGQWYLHREILSTWNTVLLYSSSNVSSAISPSSRYPPLLQCVHSVDKQSFTSSTNFTSAYMSDKSPTIISPVGCRDFHLKLQLYFHLYWVDVLHSGLLHIESIATYFTSQPAQSFISIVL